MKTLEKSPVMEKMVREECLAIWNSDKAIRKRFADFDAFLQYHIKQRPLLTVGCGEVRLV
jgi:hypothetical protein